MSGRGGGGAVTGPAFLPWLRRGLSVGIGEPDPLAGPLPLRGTVTGQVTVSDDRGSNESAQRARTLVGPGDVVGIDAAQIVRFEPPDGAVDVEDNYLAFVELASPDLPWLLSPAAPGAQGALRPWLALICVAADGPGAEFDATADPCAVLRLDAATAATELPDLAESWAWVHVHSAVPAGDVSAEVERGSGGVTARVLSPRRLRPGRRYRAALVPAFDAGRDAGLGLQPDSAPTQVRPAWDKAALPALLELPVYATWTFTTSPVAGDFEQLCQRLQPDTEGARLGYRSARVDDRDLLEPFAGPTGFEYEGALVDPESSGRDLQSGADMWFRTGMTQRLDQAAARRTVDAVPPRDYRPERDDPIVGPPLYGQWPAAVESVPDDGWLAEVNLGPDRRASAALGAKLVTEHQDELLAAAWDQAGQIRALRDELNRNRLAAEVGRSAARRIGSLDGARTLQATHRLHPYVRVGNETAAQRLTGSAVVPAALVSAAFRRQLRPGSPVGRRLAAAGGTVAAVSTVTGAFVAASAPADVRPLAAEQCARFGAGFVPDGAVTSSTAFGTPSRFDRTAPGDPLFGVTISTAPPDPAPSQPRHRRRESPWLPAGRRAARSVIAGQVIVAADDDAPLVAIQPVPAVTTTAADDVRDLAAQVRSGLDPMPATVRQLNTRVTGVRFDPARDLPVRIAIGARFATPLAPWLVDLSAELLVPGVDAIRNNRVRMLAVNESAVAALLVGANHEWAREALWHEFPADLGATAFSTFWQATVADRSDLDGDIHTWPPASRLAEHIGGTGSATVLLVRGDVIRRYPACQFLLVEPTADGLILDGDELPRERVTRPTFASTLDASTVVVGFDVDPDIVLDGGWYLGLEEPMTGPRFGLDVADGTEFRTAPPSWPELSWGHVSASQVAMDTAEQLLLAEPTWLAGVERDGVRWGRNSAHVAAILYQRPFRLLFPAGHLIRRAPGGRR